MTNYLFPPSGLLNHHNFATALRSFISIIFLCLQHSCTVTKAWLWFSCMGGQRWRGKEAVTYCSLNENKGWPSVSAWISNDCVTQPHSITENLFLPKWKAAPDQFECFAWMNASDNCILLFHLSKDSSQRSKLSSQITPIPHKILNTLQSIPGTLAEKTQSEWEAT